MIHQPNFADDRALAAAAQAQWRVYTALKELVETLPRGCHVYGLAEDAYYENLVVGDGDDLSRTSPPNPFIPQAVVAFVPSEGGMYHQAQVAALMEHHWLSAPRQGFATLTEQQRSMLARFGGYRCLAAELGERMQVMATMPWNGGGTTAATGKQRDLRRAVAQARRAGYANSDARAEIEALKRELHHYMYDVREAELVRAVKAHAQKLRGTCHRIATFFGRAHVISQHSDREIRFQLAAGFAEVPRQSASD